MGLPYWRAAFAAASLAFASFAVPAAPAGTVGTAWAAEDAAAEDDDEDEYEGLPPGEGRDEVFGYCSACHSIRLVTQQGLTRADWGEVLVYMVEDHEMAELEPEDEKLVLDYLARFYGRDRRARKMER
ncbi:MAG: hypothetical protein OXF89_02160 [Rhodospirillaceae bacterium]|nr:hypothetical protein [Rhodospirillaceae bacterium]MDE0704004.1 hypothetical protein [Rhodospirillaceae bacterium]